MTFPGRTFHRKPPPTKKAQRIDAQMVVLQRCAAGLDFPDHLVASIARTHSLTVGDVARMIADERARRAAE